MQAEPTPLRNRTELADQAVKVAERVAALLVEAVKSSRQSSRSPRSPAPPKAVRLARRAKARPVALGRNWQE